jgi:hypothetical protein
MEARFSHPWLQTVPTVPGDSSLQDVRGVPRWRICVVFGKNLGNLSDVLDVNFGRKKAGGIGCAPAIF